MYAHLFFKLFNVYDIHWKGVLSGSLLNPEAVLKHSAALGFSFVPSEAVERSVH